MTVLHLILDGALMAAQMLALVLVIPAAAEQPTANDARIERPLQWHRLSTALDGRLLGGLANVRVAQHRDDGDTAVDCVVAPTAGHARLTEDEAIADAWLLASGSEDLGDVASAPARPDGGHVTRVALPGSANAEGPVAALIEGAGQWFVIVVPHRSAAAGVLVLRPASGDAATVALRGIAPDVAIVIPLAGRRQLDDLAAGAIEFELVTEKETVWTTLVPVRATEDGRRQALMRE